LLEGKKEAASFLFSCQNADKKLITAG
jgi:hypothetical protein